MGFTNYFFVVFFSFISTKLKMLLFFYKQWTFKHQNDVYFLNTETVTVKEYLYVKNVKPEPELEPKKS